ncbi:MAG: hypothetical protein EON59_06705 [Alphaproteobacteria bacterium]|nr:MAG: hypothetical protein EON59_06705 [Alphaproteobacteria bacterium]
MATTAKAPTVRTLAAIDIDIAAVDTRLPGNSRSLDVGVDAWNYVPIDIEQIRARMAILPEWTPEEVGPDPEEATDDTGYRG